MSHDLPDRGKQKRSRQDLAQEMIVGSYKIKKTKKDLKPKSSFDSEFWDRAAFYQELQRNQTSLQLEKIELDYIDNNQGSSEDFQKTQEAAMLRQEIKAAEYQMQLCQKQSERLKTKGDVEKSTRRGFMSLFTNSRLGLNISASVAGRRDTTDQSNFRNAAIQQYALQHPNKKSGLVWDVLGNKYVPAATMTASPIFAYKHGQDVMTALFGPDAEKEMFSARNALLLSTVAEEQFDKGLFAIVPNVDPRSEAAVSLWKKSNPREYKIRILNFDHAAIDNAVYTDPDVTWRVLDGRKLVFKNNFRPRARYLYFQYCIQILRIVWGEASRKSASVISKEIGQAAWGTRGRYLAENQLRAIVDELGHDFDFLLEGGDLKKNLEGNEDLLLGAAAGQIKENAYEEESDSDED